MKRIILPPTKPMGAVMCSVLVSMMVALAGCAAGGSCESASAGSIAEVSETSTTTVLPPLEYEEPPQYPEGLEVDSPANAGRFLQFAIETLNYALRFNDVEPVQAISYPDCGFCNSTIDMATSLQAGGYRRVGAELACVVVGVEYQAETGLFFLDSQCTAPERTTYNLAGDIVDAIDAEEIAITWVVTMIDGPWMLGNAGTTVEETP